MLALRFEDGAAVALDRDRWHAGAGPAEIDVLDGLPAPVLDVGCGPGRIVAELTRRGVPALGIDPAPGAVMLARRQGAAVLQRSVFDRLPGEGRWRAVLLFDGNVGIGGDAVRLLRRCRSLVSARGVVVAEVDADGTGWRTQRARLEWGDSCTPWFRWSVVGVDAIDAVAGRAGLRVARTEQRGGRWFSYLSPADAPA